jgi:hypothetical protein
MLLRRLRAAVVLAVAWAVLWAPFGVATELLLAVWVTGLGLSGRDMLFLVGAGAVGGALWGLASGLLFSAALAAVERRGAVEHLERRRILGWGALSGAAFPTVLFAVIDQGSATLLDAIVAALAIIGLSASYGALVASLLTSVRAPKAVGSA